MSDDEVGPFGIQLADALASKCVAAIDEFPSSTEAEKQGIAAIVAAALVEYSIGGETKDADEPA